MNKTKRFLKSDQKSLTLYILEAELEEDGKTVKYERVIYTIPCINLVHYYVCATMINKFLQGEIKELDNSIIYPKEV
jgi:hypothetical protein